MPPRSFLPFVPFLLFPFRPLESLPTTGVPLGGTEPSEPGFHTSVPRDQSVKDD